MFLPHGDYYVEIVIGENRGAQKITIQ